MKNSKETRKVSNSGDFFQRVEENIKNGWIYPTNCIVSTTHNGGVSGNIDSWFKFDGKKFSITCETIPGWATDNGKYKGAIKARNAYPVNKRFGIQSFITMRK